MKKIAILGAGKEDKLYFRKELHGKVDIEFYDTLVNPAAIDPTTEILSVFVDTPVTADFFTKLPRLNLVVCRSTGVNNVDIVAAKKHGIKVANVPNYGGVTVAEYTFTLLLMLSRKMPAVLHETIAAEPNRKIECGFDLSGKTIGVLGTGCIGQGVIKIARGFGMKILAFDLYPNPALASQLGFEYVPVDKLLANSDVVTLHIPYTPENHHFLNKARLTIIKDGCTIINTARGELIDTTALVSALHRGQISGAALDVTEDEYLLDPDELLELAAKDDAGKAILRHAVSLAALQRLPNVVITNHNAFNTREALIRINQKTVQNILEA